MRNRLHSQNDNMFVGRGRGRDRERWTVKGIGYVHSAMYIHGTLHRQFPSIPASPSPYEHVIVLAVEAIPRLTSY